MRLYPAAPRPLRTTIAADLLVLLLLAVFAVLATQVHDAVDELAQIGAGVEDAGGSVQRALDVAADGARSSAASSPTRCAPPAGAPATGRSPRDARGRRASTTSRASSAG